MGGVLEKDSAPHLTARQEQTVKRLESHKAPFRRYPECFLCLVGLSPYYPFDENSYPAFEYPNGSGGCYFLLVVTADPRKVRAVEVQKGDDQVKLLESTQHCFMPLVIPAAGGRYGYGRQNEEEVVTEQSKKAKKRRLQKQSDVLLAKKLRKDHLAPASGFVFPSVAPPSQESEGFLDSSARTNLRICTTVESSSALAIPVDPTAAATTSTGAAATTGLATDVNPDLAGPSHPEESEGSGDSFYAPTTLDPSQAKRWYVPRWSITNDLLLDDGFSCCTLVDCIAPPSFFSALRSMDYDQLYTKFNVRAARQVAMGRKGAEAAEVIRLRDQISSLSEEKSALTAEVSALKITVTQKDHDISLLNSRATSLAFFFSRWPFFRSFKERMEVQQEQQAQELYNRVAELEAHVMDVSGHLEGEFYPTYLTTLVRIRWLLTHRIQLALLKCLKSPEYQGTLGHALGRAVDFGMQEGLEAGHEHGIAGRSLSAVDAYNPETAKACYFDAVKALEDVDFPLVSLLKSKKDAGMDEVLDSFLLDGPLVCLPEAAYLQPCIEQLSVPIHHAGDTMVVGETSLSFALLNSMFARTWVGEASTSAAPLSVEDYDEEDTDEALGSVVAVPKFETCRF
ncbi:hypothetical protein Tco_0987389 [Tanacetum coccineum]